MPLSRRPRAATGRPLLSRASQPPRCIFGFLYQLHFLRGLKLTGCLVVMIFEMLKTDIFAWFGVFIFVMMAFMTGYLALFMTHPLRSILTVGNTSYQETAE